MTGRARTGLALGLALACLAPACRRASEAAPEAQTAGEDPRRTACRSLVESATALEAHGEELGRLVEAAGGPEAAACLTRHALDLTRCLSPEQAAVFRQAKAELVETCLGWPDALRDCLVRGDLDSPACARAYAAEEDLVLATPQGPGPRPRWSVRLEEPAQALVALADDRVVALGARGVEAVLDGRRAWRAELPEETAGWLVAAPGGALLAGGREGGLFVLDALTGRVRARAALPAGAWPVEAARLGARVLVLASDARLFWLEPDRCLKGAADCLTPWTALGASPVRSVQPIRQGPRELSLVTADERLTALEPTGRVLFQLEARRGLGALTPLPGERLALVVDGQLAVLRPALCRSREPIRLGLPPQPEDGRTELDVEHAPPPGCAALELAVPRLAAFAPVPADPGAGGLVVVAGARLMRFDGRRESWKTEVNPASPLVVSPQGLVLLLNPGRTLASPAELRAVSASTGFSLWASELPFPTQALLEDDRPLLQLAGELLAVGLGRELSAFDLTRPPGAAP
jgi:hypothetical protein